MKLNKNLNRRQFVTGAAAAGMGALTASAWLGCANTKKSDPVVKGMTLGLVTYLWGQDWDLNTLVSHCEQTGFAGVELRTMHAHGVEPSLNAEQRMEVKKRFDESPVVCVGYGSNQEFHSPDAAELERQINGTFELIKLCHDIGASGVKVKPNTLPEGVPREKSIEQIGRSLNTVGKYAADYGQNIRVEVHGPITSELPVMHAIFKYVEQPNVGMCWNCNDVDLQGEGLEANFNLVRDRLGDTVHIRELNEGNYPYQQLFNLFAATNYNGWILLEARTKPDDRVAAMREQKRIFEEMVSITSNS